MFFKNLILWSTVFLTFGVLGCSNDHNFVDTDTIVSLAYDTNCLDELEPDFELYKQELLSQERITKDFKCLRDALDYVKLRVEGEEPDKFTSLEMERFLNKILFKEKPKPASFYKNLILIKSQIFGGDVSRITFDDFDNIKTFLLSTEKTAKALAPFASELFFETSFKNTETIETAMRSLVPFVSQWVQFVGRDISLTSVFDLIEEASSKIKSRENWISVFNLVREAKAEDGLIFNKDKDKLISAFQKYYSVALKINKSLDKDWEYKRDDFFELSREIELLLISLEATVKGHPDQKWSRANLIRFMNLASDYELVGQELSFPVREHIVDVMFGKWFPNSQSVVELTSENVKKIELAWTEIDTFLIDSKDVEGFRGKTFPYVKEGTSSFALFTQQRWPSLVQKDRTLFIPDYAPEVTFSFQSLFHVAWQFTAAKILIEAYTKDEQRLLSRTGISIEEVEEAYLDVFVFLKEIDFLDEESRGGWFRIFNEGNLFVPSADPDGFVSVSEAADYAAYMFSGVFMGEKVADSVQEACPNFVEKCSFTYIRKNSEIVFEDLPGLVGYFTNGLKKKSYRLWQKSFEYIAKLDNNDANYESSHWFRGTIANQYNEVIYRKYDTDNSDTLSFEEVSAAYIDFKAALKLLPQVKGTDNENKDDVLKSFLTLFVKDGKLPELVNGRPRGRLIRHVAFCGGVQTSTNPSCVFESDRAKIMALLAFLTSI